MECVSVLHHNKRKTNYHIHLIFSERELLPEPIEKIATRNMFYNEQKKHVRTKKEILDDSGNVRKGCKIIKKGEVYERTLFTAKNKLFKQEHYLDEAKHFYTDLINLLIEDDKDNNNRTRTTDKHNYCNCSESRDCRTAQATDTFKTAYATGSSSLPETSKGQRYS